MNNAIWRLDPDCLAAYTEDPAIMARIRRYYHDIEPMARYYRAGKRIAVQYRVPNRRKRSIRRMLGVDVARE
ncbi:hypothetical protein [Brevibacillus borstelensis]|uniref:hypothetical protein n=1 Tax=Brevibacillus borstelensis TaxID=45462 RepID=UPI0004697764|nr:hypothetical protein [Brevibacillus borstelensis]MCC0566547.1 hypothetical protein [Brevibacillus borstelensis]MCM3473057.1 hypothetical protein [Brevibacillus borstelensis]MED1852985.1 hypothetical protein [Brevibacillus borstelensis]